MKYRLYSLATGRIAALALSLCVLFGVLCLSGSLTPSAEMNVPSAAGGKNEIGEGEAAVKEFIESFGWEVSQKPVEIKEIFIPKSFDAVYDRYNEEIQLPGGYDLRRYAGQKAVLYCYEVLNYPSDDAVFANVLVCDGTVIGGDICSSRLDGFMHGFSKEL